MAAKVFAVVVTVIVAAFVIAIAYGIIERVA